MIHIDFDDTLIKQVALADVFGTLTPWPEVDPALPPAERSAEMLRLRREQRDAFERLNIHEQIDHWKTKGGVLVEDHSGWKVIAFARPNAYKFMQACLALDPTTSILTSGISNWQAKVAYRLGLPRVELYGRDSYMEVPKHTHNLLVDDLDPWCDGVQTKMKVLGFAPVKNERNDMVYPTERHLRVNPWRGDTDDNELLELLPKITGMLP